MNNYSFSGPEETFEAINEESKLRVTLSDLASSIVESDKIAFSYKSSASVLNGIFEKMCNYYLVYEEADDDVFAYRAFTKKRNYLLGLTKKEDILNEHLLKLQDQLSANINRLRDSEGKNHFMIALSGKNKAFLYNCTEATVYGAYRTGLFFRCVIETYARKPYLEREMIMAFDNIRLIRSAIQNHKILKIKTGNKTFKVKPYQIMQNPLATYSYLVGFSKTTEYETDYVPASFRISRITSIADLRQDAFISKEAERQLSAAIRDRGVQYLLGENVIIDVLLTQKGLNMYHAMSTVRPPAIERSDLPDGRIQMRFCCTQKQASDYFFQFGQDAEITGPKELRDIMIKKYEAALKSYMRNR